MKKGSNKDIEKSVQDLIKVKALENGFYITHDNRLISVLKVGVINRDLLSKAEDEALDDEYNSFLKSLYFPYQELFVSQPLDIEDLLERERSKLRGMKDFHRRKMQNSYIEFLERKGRSSNTMKRQRYFICYEKIKNQSIEGLDDTAEILMDRVKEIQLGFKDMKINTELISSLEAVKLLQIFYDFESAQHSPIQSLEVPEVITGGKKDEFFKEEAN